MKNEVNKFQIEGSMFLTYLMKNIKFKANGTKINLEFPDNESVFWFFQNLQNLGQTFPYYQWTYPWITTNNRNPARTASGSGGITCGTTFSFGKDNLGDEATSFTFTDLSGKKRVMTYVDVADASEDVTIENSDVSARNEKE